MIACARAPALAGLLLSMCACGSGSASSSSTVASGDGSGTEIDDGHDHAESETGSDCPPGRIECECLPDGSCAEVPHAIGCVVSRTGTMVCSPCLLSHHIFNSPCSGSDCPDCVIDLAADALGPVFPQTIPYFHVADVPYVEDCASEDGWTWLVIGEQLELCGSHCFAWINPAREGISYELLYDCPLPP
ncbi:MAG TPA: hypothetical protein VK034_23700 [Enhygromyxa sp.]|nr:hypothetical protein [Enhygromyxa sp.]